jgi:putative FmdB family regulatory protein
MPIYTYYCTNCKRKWEAFHPIVERNNEFCCGERAVKKIDTLSKPVIHEYYSENLNARITGPKQKARIMKEKGVEQAC